MEFAILIDSLGVAMTSVKMAGMTSPNHVTHENEELASNACQGTSVLGPR
jgi:hypothetical protein